MTYMPSGREFENLAHRTLKKAFARQVEDGEIIRLSSDIRPQDRNHYERQNGYLVWVDRDSKGHSHYYMGLDTPENNLYLQTSMHYKESIDQDLSPISIDFEKGIITYHKATALKDVREPAGNINIAEFSDHMQSMLAKIESSRHNHLEANIRQAMGKKPSKG